MAAAVRVLDGGVNGEKNPPSKYIDKNIVSVYSQTDLN
jgi:hypothetical protein